jgi:hypothetical protein
MSEICSQDESSLKTLLPLREDGNFTYDDEGVVK